MYCPICGNNKSSGRCPHSLSDRSQAVSRASRIIEDHEKGRIDIAQRTQQLSNLYKGGR